MVVDADSLKSDILPQGPGPADLLDGRVLPGSSAGPVHRLAPVCAQDYTRMPYSCLTETTPFTGCRETGSEWSMGRWFIDMDGQDAQDFFLGVGCSQFLDIRFVTVKRSPAKRNES